MDEPATAIFSAVPTSHEPASRAYGDGGVSGHYPARNTTPRSLIAAIICAVIFAAVGFGGYFYFTQGIQKQISSIAVMPFINDSGNPDLEYLSDGITETLIGSLAQLPGLNVKARSTVFRYKGKDASAADIGKALGVQALLNGRVIQRGDQLSLSLELIDAATENVIWSDKYDRKLTDLVTLQNEIAQDVSDRLRLKLSGEDEKKLSKTYTTDPEVYRLYLQGRFYWNKRTFSEVAKGIPYFRQAVEKDPNFALGYVGLADSNEDNDRPLKKQYIQRALEIDPDLAEAHASLGYQYMLDYNWTASERELKRAAELNPKYPQAYAWNGARLMMIGKYDESMAEIQRALDLDPTSNGINFYKAVCLGVAGRLDDAIQFFKKIIEMDPTFPWAHSHLSRLYRINGDLAAAAAERATSLELDGKPEQARAIRDTFAKSGWDGVQRYQAQFNPDSFYWGLIDPRQNEQWIERLQQQAVEGNFWLFLIKTDPAFDPLREDPRFQALEKKFDPPR